MYCIRIKNKSTDNIYISFKLWKLKQNQSSVNNNQDNLFFQNMTV